MGKVIYNSDIRELQKEVYQINVDHGFHENMDGTETAPLKLALVHAEVSEALEELRDGKILTYYSPEKPTKPEGFGIELADAVIRIMDIAESMGIDLTECINIKTEYNRTRPYKHGKKF